MNGKPYRLLQTSYTVHNRYAADQMFPHSIQTEKMARQLAHAILEAGYLQTIEGDYATEKRLSVIVCDPQQFARLVQEEARKYASNYPSDVFSSNL